MLGRRGVLARGHSHAAVLCRIAESHGATCIETRAGIVG